MDAGPIRRYTRSWYGLPVEIVIEGDYWHWVKAGPVPLPHPPVVNLIVRHGLPRDARLRLSYFHEMGHIQTLPLALIHLAWVWKHRPEWAVRSWTRRMAWLGLFMMTHQAVWELTAESYVCAQNSREYRQFYTGTEARLARMFWALMGLLALFGTLALVKRK